MLPCVGRLIVGALLVGSISLNFAQSEGAPRLENTPCPPPVASMGPARPMTAPLFFDAAALDYARLIPPPPAPDTLVAEAELDVVRQVQAMRTPADVEWARLVDTDCVFNLASVLGPWFRREKLPVTEVFFSALTDEIRAVDRASKAPFQRPRPHVADPTIRPCVRVPTSPSYPSGSALQAFLWAELFAEIFPEKRADLTARAERAAWGRVLGGVHFPSDLAAGRRLVPAFLAECRKSSDFRAALERCRAELLAASAGREPNP